MLGYLAIAFRHPIGSWVAIVPDFVGVTGRGNDLTAAVREAKSAAQAILDVLTAAGAAAPMPTDLKVTQRNLLLVNRYGVDWPNAVVSFIVLNAGMIASRLTTSAVKASRLSEQHLRQHNRARMTGSATCLPTSRGHEDLEGRVAAS